MRNLFVTMLIASCAFAALASGTAPQPFKISISTEKSEVKAGTDVWVKVSVTNTSNHVMDMSANINDMIGVNPNYTFDVRNSAGTPAAKRTYKHLELATGSPIFRSLKPGESLTDEQNLSRLDDFSQPGQYQIQVSQRVSDNDKDGVIKSNTITVTVTP
jgi:surface-anchored protein